MLTPYLLQHFPKVDPEHVYPLEPPHVPSLDTTVDTGTPLAAAREKQLRAATAHTLSECIGKGANVVAVKPKERDASRNENTTQSRGSLRECSETYVADRFSFR
jgi:hypothetical protein